MFKKINIIKNKDKTINSRLSKVESKCFRIKIKETKPKKNK